jgi:cobalt/nickel transport system permease protein
VSATFRLLLALAMVVTIAVWPNAAWRWQAAPALLLLGLSAATRLPPGALVRRMACVGLLAGLTALGLAGTDGWLLRTLNLLMKSTLSVWTLSILTHCTPLPDLVAALRRLGIPRVWADSIAFWGRYYAVLADEWHTLQLARRSRTLTRDHRLKFRALTNGLGVLFIRAYERAEQVHQAMLARGYRVDG